MKTLSIRVDESMYKRLQELCTQYDRSLNWVVNMIIQSFFEQNDIKKEVKDGGIA